MANLLRFYGSLSAKIGKWTSVKPLPDDLPRLVPYFVQGLQNFSGNPKQPPARTFIELEKQGLISLEDMRKLTWLGANMFDKENGIGTGPSDNFWTIVKNGHEDPLHDFNACAHFLLGFSKSTFLMNYKVDNPDKRNLSDSDIEKIQMDKMQNVLSAIGPEQFSGLMNRVEQFGLGEIAENIVNNKNGVYLKSKEMKKRHQQWKKSKLEIKDINSEMTNNPNNQKRRYSIADKQAFFDGVDIQAYMVTMDCYHLTPEKCKNAAINVSQAMMGVSKKTQLKTGLLKTLETEDDELRHALLLGFLFKSTSRATDMHIKAGATGREKDPHGFNTQLCHYALNHKETRELFFQKAYDENALPELYFIKSACDSYAPEGTIDNLIKWCEDEDNDIDLDKILDDYELPKMDNLDAIIEAGYEARKQSTTPQIEVEKDENSKDPIIETVEVAEEIEEETPVANDNQPDAPISPIQTVMVPDLLPEGEGVETAPDLVEIFREEAGEKKDRDIITEPRDEWITELLVNDENINHAACRHYVNPLETTDHMGRYYSVFHVVTLDGNTTQIAVSTCKGQGTYLMKMEHGLMVNPNTEQCVRDLGDLRKEGMVQTKRCHSKEGFQRDIAEIINKPHDALKPQSKGIVRWQGVMSRATQLENSVMDYYLHTNKAPTRNSGIIAHGDTGENEMGIKRSLIELDTRWDLADSAIKQKLIMGLEDFASLYEYTTFVIAGEKPAMLKAQVKKLTA